MKLPVAALLLLSLPLAGCSSDNNEDPETRAAAINKSRACPTFNGTWANEYGSRVTIHTKIDNQGEAGETYSYSVGYSETDPQIFLEAGGKHLGDDKNAVWITCGNQSLTVHELSDGKEYTILYADVDGRRLYVSNNGNEGITLEPKHAAPPPPPQPEEPVHSEPATPPPSPPKPECPVFHGSYHRYKGEPSITFATRKDGADTYYQLSDFPYGELRADGSPHTYGEGDKAVELQLTCGQQSWGSKTLWVKQTKPTATWVTYEENSEPYLNRDTDKEKIALTRDGAE
jgi:hypothetical protein